MLPLESLAVMVKLKELPAVEDVGTELISSSEADEELTVMFADVTLKLPSVTVRVRVPTDFKLTAKVRVPEIRLDA
jgi:hypothetical protein